MANVSAAAGNRNPYVYVVAGLSALGGLLIGYDTGVISGAMLFIQDDFQLTPFLQGFVVSSLLVGAMVGALGCGPLTDRFGRRPVILLAAVIFAMGLWRPPWRRAPMTIVGMNLVDRVGRKPLLLSGLVGMALSLGVLGSAFLFASLSGAVSWIAVGCLLVYIASFAVSIGVVIFIIPSEIFPLKVRGSAMGACLLTNWGTNFVITLTFLSLIEAIGEPGTFWLYALVCVAFWLFAYFFIPETKGRSLEEIEKDLRSRTTA